MQLADRVQHLKPSATLAISAKAQELKAAGHDILSLSVGEPDFPTPKHICDAAKNAIDAGFTRYTAVPGTPELRAAAAGYFTQHYGVQAGPENIIIGNGGKQCLYNLFQAVLNPGDHVLIPAPYWVSYPPMVELAGAKPVIIPSSAEAGFKISIAALEAAHTPKTRMLVLNSPSNPTGACYTQKELEAIAAWAIAHNVLVAADEIYDQLIYDGKTPLSLAPVWEKNPEHVVVLNGTAKSFAMTGWRVGYALAHPDYIKAMTRLQGQSTSNVCSVAQKAAEAALRGGLAEVEVMKQAFERRRNLAMEIVGSWPDVLCPRPQGAFYIFPDMHRHFTKAMPDSTAMCALLLDKAGVAAVPGAAFGNDNCLRFSYAVSDENLERALTKVGKTLFG